MSEIFKLGRFLGLFKDRSDFIQTIARMVWCSNDKLGEILEHFLQHRQTIQDQNELIYFDLLMGIAIGRNQSMHDLLKVMCEQGMLRITDLGDEEE